MAHWLYKSEPASWSWEQQVAQGAKGTNWSGVRNHMAKQNLIAMKKGDKGFFYHSNEGKAVVGIVEVIKEYYPDPTDESGRFGMVDLKAVKPLKRPVTPRRDQGRAAAQGHGARHELAALRAAGDRCAMGPDLQDGWIIAALVAPPPADPRRRRIPERRCEHPVLARPLSLCVMLGATAAP